MATATDQVFLKKDIDRLNNLFYVFRTGQITFSKATAAKIVGGRYALEKLVKEKKIRMDKPHPNQNSEWKCNGEDVLRHAVQYAFF